MKFKAIERLVKTEGYIALLDERVEDEKSVCVARQWMGDGRAFYPLDGLPRLTEEGKTTGGRWDTPCRRRKTTAPTVPKKRFARYLRKEAT